MRSPSEQMDQALATGQDVTVQRDGSVELSGISIPGLPEGLLAVRYGDIEKDGEYILFPDGVLHNGPNFQGLIVKLANDYELQFDIMSNRMRPFRKFQIPHRISVEFKVSNTKEESAVRGLKSMAGFIGIEE